MLPKQDPYLTVLLIWSTLLFQTTYICEISTMPPLGHPGGQEYVPQSVQPTLHVGKH